ncbi:phosphodiester glycosidase family protein [Streptomyces sp. NPDC005435]|uniref:phosphodiester glycosidase family protein n=1 Tax=Streptomyces sp. NPDC005435 TaxID=3154464 RepID=UPI0034525335
MNRRSAVAASCGAVFALLTVFVAPAGAAPEGTQVVRGVRYRQFDVTGAAGTARAHLLTVDLGDRHVRVRLLHPGAVAARETVSRLTETAGAVAGVNGDFFDITETRHPGVEATGATSGPAVADGRAMKAAVPAGQRFGPTPPPGTTGREVVGVGIDHRARPGRLRLVGSVHTAAGTFALGGLNQYAVPQDSIGAFTMWWGTVSRARAVCGTDTDRAGGCDTDAREVAVRGGRVVTVSEGPGGGPIDRDTTVLLGRGGGARLLGGLSVGDRVRVRYGLVAGSVPYAFAIGGFPVLSRGEPLPGLDDTVAAVRTAVGITPGGRGLLLLALDGSADYRSGLTLAEEAGTLRRLGAAEGFNLDGGGSTELVTRERGGTVVIRSHPSGGAERPVPNGIGVFAVP